jgi:mannose-binding lectin 2
LTTRIQARGNRNAQIPTKAKFTYFQDKSLKLELQYKAEDEWTECFDVPNLKVPPVAYLGFSAETGELSDNHDIISVKTLNLYQHNTGSNAAAAAGSSSKGSSSKPYEATKKKSRGSWTWFFMKFVLFGLAVTGAYVGFTIYRARQRDRF